MAQFVARPSSTGTLLAFCVDITHAGLQIGRAGQIAKLWLTPGHHQAANAIGVGGGDTPRPLIRWSWARPTDRPPCLLWNPSLVTALLSKVQRHGLSGIVLRWLSVHFVDQPEALSPIFSANTRDPTARMGTGEFRWCGTAEQGYQQTLTR